MTGNGSRDTNGTFGGENGNGMEPRNSSRWDSASSRFGPNYHGSLESLASRDWDTMSDRVRNRGLGPLGAGTEARGIRQV